MDGVGWGVVICEHFMQSPHCMYSHRVVTSSVSSSSQGMLSCLINNGQSHGRRITHPRQAWCLPQQGGWVGVEVFRGNREGSEGVSKLMQTFENAATGQTRFQSRFQFVVNVEQKVFHFLFPLLFWCKKCASLPSFILSPPTV